MKSILQQSTDLEYNVIMLLIQRGLHCKVVFERTRNVEGGLARLDSALYTRPLLLVTHAASQVPSTALFMRN